MYVTKVQYGYLFKISSDGPKNFITDTMLAALSNDSLDISKYFDYTLVAQVKEPRS